MKVSQQSFGWLLTTLTVFWQNSDSKSTTLIPTNITLWEKKKSSTNNLTLGCSQGYKILKIIIRVYRCSIYSLNCYYCYHHSSACGEYDEIVSHLRFMEKISFLVLVRSGSFMELFIGTSWQSKSIFSDRMCRVDSRYDESLMINLEIRKTITKSLQISTKSY